MIPLDTDNGAYLLPYGPNFQSHFGANVDSFWEESEEQEYFNVPPIQWNQLLWEQITKNALKAYHMKWHKAPKIGTEEEIETCSIFWREAITRVTGSLVSSDERHSDELHLRFQNKVMRNISDRKERHILWMSLVNTRAQLGNKDIGMWFFFVIYIISSSS